MRRLLLAFFFSASTAMSTTRAPVAVIGSTGKLGRLAVKELVAHGYPARCLVRHDPTGASASAAADATGAEVAAWLGAMPGVELVRGDVTDPQSLATLLQGTSAVLAMHGAGRTRKLSDLWRDATLEESHAKQVNYEGVRHILDAARASATCKRVVRITGKGEKTRFGHEMWSGRYGQEIWSGEIWSERCGRSLFLYYVDHFSVVRPYSIWFIGEKPSCREASSLMHSLFALSICVCVSPLYSGETPWSVPSIMINALGCMAKAWNYEGERLLRACPDVEYTIIRPGIMNDETQLAPKALALADDGGDLKVRERTTSGARPPAPPSRPHCPHYPCPPPLSLPPTLPARNPSHLPPSRPLKYCRIS